MAEIRIDTETKKPRETSALSRFTDSDFFYKFKRSPVAVVSFAVVLLLVLSAVFAPLIAPYIPFVPASLNLMIGFSAQMQPYAFTGDTFWLGTDDQGRDVFSTILYGMRISLFVGFAAVLFALILGVTLGLIAGYVGGWTETIIMRVADVQLTFPSILVAMLIFGIAKGFTPVEYRDQMAIWVLIIAIGLSDWVQFARVVRGATLVEQLGIAPREHGGVPLQTFELSAGAAATEMPLGFSAVSLTREVLDEVMLAAATDAGARVVRGATLVEKNKEYVQAARLIGRTGPAIMMRHILPNVLSPVLVIATISLALAIIAEATLSFLGVGAPPTQPSLGTLIRIGQGFLFSGEWWILFFPAITLLALALSVNLLGDWLRDALNPRLK